VRLNDSEKTLIGYYYCEYGLKYSDIAGILGVSEPTISRIIKDLRRNGYVQDHPTLELPVEEIEKLRFGIQEAKTEIALMDKYRHKGLRGAVVTPVSTEKEFEERSRETTRYVTLKAARWLERVLTSGSCHYVGVLWGTTLKYTIDAIIPKQKNPRLIFVPLRGGLGLQDTHSNYRFAIQCYSNAITTLMAHKFGAPPPLQLTVPAFIPRCFADDEDKISVIWQFIEQDATYKTIFVGRRRKNNSKRPSEALINKLDTVLTGIGSGDQSGAWVRWTDHIADEEKPMLKSVH